MSREDRYALRLVGACLIIFAVTAVTPAPLIWVMNTLSWALPAIRWTTTIAAAVLGVGLIHLTVRRK